MNSLRGRLSASSGERSDVRALKLYDCERLSDMAIAALLAVPAADTKPPREIDRKSRESRESLGEERTPVPKATPSHAYLSSLRSAHLQLPGGRHGRPLAEAVENDHLTHLIGLALDRNKLTLIGEASTFYAAPLALRFGRALRRLTKLEQVDLCHNDQLSDEACATFCASLLSAADTSADGAAGEQKSGGRQQRGKKVALQTADDGSAAGPRFPPSVRILHLGRTGAGNLAARAIAEVLPTCQLQSLCLNGDVGDPGATAIAEVLPLSASCASCGSATRLATRAGEDCPGSRPPHCPLSSLASAARYAAM